VAGTWPSFANVLPGGCFNFLRRFGLMKLNQSIDTVLNEFLRIAGHPGDKNSVPHYIEDASGEV